VARYVACRFYIQIPFNDDLYWTDIHWTVSFYWHQNSPSKLTWRPPLHINHGLRHHILTIDRLNHGDSVVLPPPTITPTISLRCQWCRGRGLSADARGEEQREGDDNDEGWCDACWPNDITRSHTTLLSQQLRASFATIYWYLRSPWSGAEDAVMMWLIHCTAVYWGREKVMMWYDGSSQ
jgi:hypothetical protein